MDFNKYTPDCIYYYVSRAYLASTSLLKKELSDNVKEAIKPAYLGVLLILWDDDGLQASELGKKAGLEPSSMTGLIDRMERDKLIVRKADPKDRRALRIHLTAAGKKAQKPVRKAVDEALVSVFDGISDQELELTKKVLKNLIENIHRKKNESVKT